MARYEEGIDAATDLRRQANESQHTAEELRRNLAALIVKVESESKTQQTTSNTALELHHKLEGAEESKWQTEESALAALLRQAHDLKLLAERNQQSALGLEEAQIARGNAIDAIENASSRISTLLICSASGKNLERFSSSCFEV